MNGLTPEQVAQMMSMLQANQQPMQLQAPIQGADAVIGFSVPIKINSPLGSVKIMVNFSATQITPMSVQMAMQQLQALGMQIDAWQPQPKPSYGGAGGFNRGGFNRGGGW